MELELRHLRVVRAVADEGSITKAALALGVPQPALTTQLRRIERGLGGVLFERDRRGARVTPLGELVLQRARVVLAAVDTLEDEVSQLASCEDGGLRYRLGSTNTPILGGLIERLMAVPRASVTAQTSWSTSELASRVLHRQLDYVIAGSCADPRLPVKPTVAWAVVAVDPVFAVVAMDHPAAGDCEIHLADLADAYWAMTPGDDCFGACFAAACARAGFTPKTVYEADVSGCLDLVARGRTAALCQPTFRPYPGVVMIPLSGAPVRWRQIIGWHPDAECPEDLIEMARAAYADAVRMTPRYASWLKSHPGFGLARNEPSAIPYAVSYG